MSERALLLGLLLIAPGALAAQGQERSLERRVANLAAREAQLQAAAAARDTVSWARERFEAIGQPPLTVLVPGWVAPEAAPQLTSLVDSWTVRAGAAFAGARPDTLRVAVRSDTVGWSQEQIATMLNAFPLEVLARARQGAQQLLGRRLGGRMTGWLAGPLPLVNGVTERRTAIFALARDTTGVGPRCLAGEVPECLVVLGRNSFAIGAARRSLVAYTLDRAGPDGWTRFVRDTTAAPEARIGAVGGKGYEAAVDAWIQDIRFPASRDERDPWLLPVTFGWSAVLLALFLWRLTWHRA